MLTAHERWIPALRLIIASVLLALILQLVHWPDLIATLLGMRPAYAMAALSAFAGVSLLDAMRIRLVLPEADLSLRFLIKIQILSSAPANVSPAQLGGDAYRIFRLNALGVDLLTATARIALLRVLGMALVVTVTALALPVSPVLSELLFSSVSRDPILGWMVATLSLVAIMLTVWWSGKRLRGSRRMFSGLGVVTMGRLLIVSLVMLVLRAMTLGLLGRTIGIDAGYVDTVLITCLATLATVLPISIAGIGVREGVIVALLSATGSDYDASVGVAILSRTLMVTLGLTGVVWWLLERRRTTRPR